MTDRSGSQSFTRPSVQRAARLGQSNSSHAGNELSRREAVWMTVGAVVPSAAAARPSRAERPSRSGSEALPGIIPPKPAWAGLIDVKSFGAAGSSNSYGTTGSDDTWAIQSALNHVGRLGGGTLYFPEGNYRVTSYLKVPANVVLRGAGQKITTLVGTHAGGGGPTAAERLRNGSVLYSEQPINRTNGVNLVIEHMHIFNSNPANQGAGFYQQSGAITVLRNCEIGQGFKYGVVLDQSEDVLIDNCVIAASIPGGAGLWIVNGADLNPSASSGFSNIIAVRDSELNVTEAAYGILDDGGYAHSFRGCNFVTGLNGIRACGVDGLEIDGCYFESQTDHNIVLTAATFAGIRTSGCFTTIVGGFISQASGKHAIESIGGGTLTVIGGCYPGGSATPLGGTSTLSNVAIINPGLPGYPDTVEFCDGPSNGRHFESAKIHAPADGSINRSSTGSSERANHGEVFFDLADDGTLKIGVKGSDGTIRSATLKLA